MTTQLTSATTNATHVTIQVTHRQAELLHDMMLRLGHSLHLARIKARQDNGLVQPPTASKQENLCHDLVRQLAIPVAAIQARNNTL